MPTALITGTSTGIGQETARHLARQGYHVFASMRTPETGSAPLRELAEKEDLKIDIVQLDVNDPASCEQAVQEVLQKAGQIDVLINNAGVGGSGAIEETPDERLKAVFETNFFGDIRMCRLVVPGMRERQSCTIVNITSVAGRITGAMRTAYSASKHALEAATECLAQEVRRFNIRVALIEPGVIQTPIFGKNKRVPDPDSPYADLKYRDRRYFAKRLENPSQPELVAKAIHHAIETDRPKLRYPVGEDAKRRIAGRERLTDEEWVDFGRAMSEDEWAAFYREHFDLEV
ncbi:MAG: SDR family oxidoreductase [bacterium]|nr:SDR family oxidoreductase [bacterium]